MAYKITSSDTHKIILERQSVKMAAGCFVAVGSLFFLIGVGLNYFMTTWEMPFLVFRVLFPLFGLVAVFAGLRNPKQVQSTQPEHFIFDHDKGAVIVQMTKAGDERGYIRYDEIAGFDVYVESRRSGSGSSSRTSYYYHVLIKKKDGGEWHIMEFNNRDEADAMVDQLYKEVPLDKPFTISNTSTLTSKIEKKEGLDKTVIHWQNKVGMGGPIFLVVFSFVFLSIISAFFSFDSNSGMDIFFYLVIGFIVTVFCIVIFSVVRKMIKDVTTRYAVAVDHTNLEYYEFSKKTGQMKNKRILPLNEVKRINYTYAPSRQYVDSGLRILTQADISKEEEDQNQRPLEALKSIFSSQQGPVVLSITALNPVECLQLESWLQELILKKGHQTVQ